jgi:hypothetical protein
MLPGIDHQGIPTEHLVAVHMPQSYVLVSWPRQQPEGHRQAFAYRKMPLGPVAGCIHHYMGQ